MSTADSTPVAPGPDSSLEELAMWMQHRYGYTPRRARFYAAAARGLAGCVDEDGLRPLPSHPDIDG